MGGICTTQQQPVEVAAPRSRASICCARNAAKFITAAARGDLRTFVELLRDGIHPDLEDRSGRCALHLASAEGHFTIVQMLVARGADVNKKDKHGRSPLLEALLAEHHHVVQTLMSAGAVLSDEHQSELDIKLHLKGPKPMLTRTLSGLRPREVTGEEGHSSPFIRNFNSAGSGCLRDNDVDSDCSSVLSRKGSNAANFLVMEAFPPKIASAVIKGSRIQPVEKNLVSLLYSDIAGFTKLSSTMPADKVSSMLNRLFSKFDRLAHVHGVQKVDIIGDAYVAATNLFEDQPDDHAARLAHFAIDMAAAAHDTLVDDDDECGDWEAARPRIAIRVGLHCGPVHARMVESGAPRFTLLGETVHTAAAMESGGAAGRIHCSTAFARLVASQAHDVALDPRDPAPAGSPPPAGPAAASASRTFWLSSVRQQRRRSWGPELAGDCPCGPSPSTPVRPRVLARLGSRGGSSFFSSSPGSASPWAKRDAAAASSWGFGATLSRTGGFGDSFSRALSLPGWAAEAGGGAEAAASPAVAREEVFLRVRSHGLLRMRTEVFRL